MMVAVDESTIQTTPTTHNSRSFAVDAEHTGIRSVGCLALVGSGILLFFIGGMLTNLPALVVIFGSITLAAIISYGLEKYLKQTWPSGRVLEVNPETIILRKHQEIESSINPQQLVNVLTWTFKVKRATRVKKGWHVVSISLEQDGDYIPVYTFASPEEFENLPLSEHFTMLERNKKSKKEKTKTSTNMRHAGEQRRLHEAEYNRGIIGAEVTLSEFTEYIEFLQKNYAKWMIS
ncbi:MAG: hypothetical protein Q9P01_14120 [Anaerolineae bacterium]|nr:hypothetical protein [Anaerolineae bacterium]MDQ7035917.1 hypothetical protein [Anaerolineae bacterium]